MFRRQALEDAGGFRFWTQLPPEHCGEDVVAQWRVMEKFGGAGILPTGAGSRIPHHRHGPSRGGLRHRAGGRPDCGSSAAPDA